MCFDYTATRLNSILLKMADETSTVLPERPKEDGTEPETKISKNALKKLERKAEKKQNKEARPKITSEQKVPPPKKEKGPAEQDIPLDPNAMFREGFLKNVYNEKPSKNVITRVGHPFSANP